MNPKPVRTAGNSAFANPPDNIRCGKSGMSANSISDGLLRFLHLYFTRRTGFSFVRVALALYGQWHSLSDPELEHSLTLQMLDPEIAIEFDSDPKQARASRQDALKDAATRKIWIAGAHMPFPGIEHIRAESNGATLGCRWNIPRSKSTAKCNNLTKTDRTFLRGSRQMTAFLCYGDFSL